MTALLEAPALTPAPAPSPASAGLPAGSWLAPPASPRPQDSRFLEAADAIGCRLVRDALWHGPRCSWLVWSKERVGNAFQSVHRAATNDLYLGVAGMALFLTRLAMFTGDRLQVDAALGALAQVEAQLARREPQRFGFYTGTSGAAWALLEAGHLWREARWRDAGLAALRRTATEADLDACADLLGGQAGLAAVLACVAHREADEALADAAARVADRLVASAHQQGEWVSWSNPEPESAHLLGLSHGASGMALGLMEVQRIRPKDTYAHAITGALRYERARFDPVRRNWPDYRLMPGMPATEPSFPVAWCHGAAGIGIARLRMLELLPGDEDLRQDVDAALQTTREVLQRPLDPASSDVSLCHGTSGLNDFVLMAAGQAGRTDARATAISVGDALLQNWHHTGMPWGCGVPDSGETPSLMTGTAGIGYHLLRLHDPSVPTVLFPGASGKVS